MTWTVPERFRDEQCEVEAMIRQAFANVCREGGVSWTEAEELDNGPLYGGPAAARALDTEQRWEDLVDDPRWDDEQGVGGFPFLDAIGFTYYVAPAMIRALRRGSIEYRLECALIPYDHMMETFAHLTPPQAAAVARFVRLIRDIEAHETDDNNNVEHTMANSYERYWNRFDTPPT